MNTTEGQRIARLETEMSYVSQATKDIAVDIKLVRESVQQIELSLAKQSGARTAAQWMTNVAIGLLGVLAGWLGLKHGAP